MRKRILDKNYCANISDPVIKQYVDLVNETTNKLAEFARDNSIDFNDALTHANGSNHCLFTLFMALDSCEK